MAVFISVTTNSFQSTFEQQSNALRGGALVRRPLRGIVLKEESFAYLRVVRSDGTPIHVLDGGAKPVPGDDSESPVGTSPGTTNFLLQQVSEQRMEKQQVVETFGEDYIFFFGEKPRFVSFMGTLMNTQNFNWKNEFQANYDQILRGTKLLEADARAYMTFDDTMVEGYVTDSSVVLDTGSPYEARFSFQMFVTNHTTVSRAATGSISIPALESALAPEGSGEAANTTEFRTRIGENVSTRLEARRVKRAEEAALIEANRRAGASPPPKTYSDLTDEYVIQGQESTDYAGYGPSGNRTFREKGKAEIESRFGKKMGYANLSGAQIGAKAVTDLAGIGVQANSLKNQSLLTGPNAFNGITQIGTFGLGRATGSIAQPFKNAVGA